MRIIELFLNENALAGALILRIADRVLEARGDRRKACATAGIANDIALFDVGQAVIPQREHRGTEVFAQAVAGAELLVDPNLHRIASISILQGRSAAQERRVLM
jgi:hypothetical protein